MNKKYVPGFKKLIIYLVWVLFLYSIFFLTYIPVNRFNAQRPDQSHLYFLWETRIQMIPEFMIFYCSIVIAFGLPLFLISIPDIHLLGFRFLVIMLISTLIFLLFPTTNGFSREIPDGFLHGIFSFLFNADKPCNLFPSMHISFSVTLALTMMKLRSISIKTFICIWLFFVCVSVVFVHQHHLADIAGGIVLSLFAMRLIKHSPHFFEFITNRIYSYVKKSFDASQ